MRNLHGPYWIKNAIEQGKVSGLEPAERTIASRRWQRAIEEALDAERSISVLDTIDGNRTALLVIDMQRAFLDPGASIEVPEGKSIIQNINNVAARIREAQGMVVFFRYLVNENLGMLKYFEKKSYLPGNRVPTLEALSKDHPQFELHPDLDVREGDLILDKVRYSAVIGSNIVEILHEHDIENVIVTGVTTDVCAGNTTEDLMQKDFHVVMVWDGTAALNRLEHELYLARIFGIYGDVMPTEEVIRRIC